MAYRRISDPSSLLPILKEATNPTTTTRAVTRVTVTASSFVHAVSQRKVTIPRGAQPPQVESQAASKISPVSCHRSV